MHNPDGVIYGRIPGFHLSERGHRMAELAALSLAGHPIAAIWASPLQRTQESAAPWVARFGPSTGSGTGSGTAGPLVTEPRLIEPANEFEGYNIRKELRRRPMMARYLLNPSKPSWGEPFVSVASRMMAAVADAHSSVESGEVVLVSHQLPIWMVARTVQGKRLASDPRTRRCSLSSITTIQWRGDTFVEVDYQEPARELLAESIDLGAV